MSAATREQFIRDVLSNRINRAILANWSSFELTDGWLVAGCLFQTAWNLRCGRAPEAGIKDYDIFYFDDRDLSAESEARVQQRVNAVMGGLDATVEVKNQARVHLWYEEHFGFPYDALASAADGIDRFLVPATCVGIRPSGPGYEVYAPNGLEIMYAGQLAPNPLTPHMSLFARKAASYKQRWDWLQVRTSL
ncbi:nucleotidyltransferase family protein [Ramlibacter albus]|uniref:Nucleotidyltransferase family protein n=1 Tax=Ramlibacter albus TaxID=2079448 RepID=A0A923MCZ9_9BURK|nr:nucleotidyltransferase family protein [Ramlibacter albus]MBC5767039.1 nucleotidyltransferase family protein [Ramlibacter albus]